MRGLICLNANMFLMILWMSIYQPVFRSLATSLVVGFAGSVVLSEDVVGNSEIKYTIHLQKHDYLSWLNPITCSGPYYASHNTVIWSSIYLSIYFCRLLRVFVYGNHLSGVIIFLKTTGQIIDTEKKTYTIYCSYQLNCSENWGR